MNGFLNVLKPPGMTSAAVVALVRRATGEKRVGHAGTLDPEAAGVLPVMVGRCARLFDYLTDKEKTYVAEVAFGCATDTQDATGRVVAEGDRYPDRAAVEAAARQLTGDILQRPGMFSALKRDGTPLYVLARQGKAVEVEARPVHIDAIDLGPELPDHGFLMTVRCGRGTYIRSLCSDLGDLVGCPAHMRFLLRAQSGAFDLSTALTVEEITALADSGELAGKLLAPDMPLGHLPRVDVSPRLRKQAMNGASVPAEETGIGDGETARMYLDGVFWGMAAREGDALVWRCLIPPETVEEN